MDRIETTATVEHFPIARFLSKDQFERLEPARFEALAEYLKAFAIFNDKVCICHCGLLLSGLLGMFTWAIQHGEGYCNHCDWPARGAHHIEVEGYETMHFQVPLPYHPDFVETREVT